MHTPKLPCKAAPVLVCCRLPLSNRRPARPNLQVIQQGSITRQSHTGDSQPRTEKQVCSWLGDSFPILNPGRNRTSLNLNPLGICCEQAVARSRGGAIPALSLVVLQYEQKLRAMDLVVRQHEASLAAQSQQLQTMQVRP